MTDFEWVSNELKAYQRDEIAAVERVKNAQNALTRAKTELAEAKEDLAGIRGGIAEFKWQKEFLEEHGRLP